MVPGSLNLTLIQHVHVGNRGRQFGSAAERCRA